MDANDPEILENQDSWTNEEADDADATVDDEVDQAAPSDAEGTAESGVDAAAEAAAVGAEWYVVHSYSGYENKVKKNLEQRIETMGMQSKIFRVVVPTEEEVEIRDGQRRTSRRRVFPGYILVQMVMDDESWYVVRNTPGVTGFVGSGTRPTPLSEEEVEKILRRMETEQPRIKVSFRAGETVRITEGPFADFMAVVDELYPDRGKVRVLVSFFGRETPVEMDFLQVERI
jgi:transcription termination/antitermination protein NusG